LYFNIPPPLKIPYFDIVVGLAWSNDLDSYADSRIATGRTSHARQVQVVYRTAPPGWGLSVRLTTPPHKKYIS